MKEESEKNYRTDFPKVTICLNSMHSLEKLERNYPEFIQTNRTKNNITQIQTPILSAFYGQNPIPPGTNLFWGVLSTSSLFLVLVFMNVAHST